MYFISSEVNNIAMLKIFSQFTGEKWSYYNCAMIFNIIAFFFPSYREKKICSFGTKADIWTFLCFQQRHWKQKQPYVSLSNNHFNCHFPPSFFVFVVILHPTLKKYTVLPWSLKYYCHPEIVSTWKTSNTRGFTVDILLFTKCFWKCYNHTKPIQRCKVFQIKDSHNHDSQMFIHQINSYIYWDMTYSCNYSPL